jgi:hypothetical protein
MASDQVSGAASQNKNKGFHKQKISWPEGAAQRLSARWRSVLQAVRLAFRANAFCGIKADGGLDRP